MNTDYRLSVIIPVYNASRYLEKCLNSIIPLLHTNGEILLVDDGSTDESLNLCLSYSEKYENLKTIHQVNAGVSCARNTGIEAAKGTYLMFVDSDDFVDFSLISDLLRAIGDYDFAIAGYSLYDDIKKKVINTFPCRDTEGTIQNLTELIDNYIYPPFLLGPCFKLFKRSIVIDNEIRFPKDISYCEDAMFVFDYLKYAKSFVSVCNSGYFYRQHGSETLSTKFKEDLFDCEVMLNQKIEEFVRVNHQEEKLPLIEERLFGSLIIYLRKLACSTLTLTESKNVLSKQVKKYNLKELVDRSNKSGFDALIVKQLVLFPNRIFLIKLLKIEVLTRAIIKNFI